MRHEGGCLCGSVRYEVEGAPLASGICHCRSCRRAASAPTLPFLVFAADRFRITQGRPAEYRSSPGVTRGFCGHCGSPLTWRGEAEPGTVDVTTCSLDDPEAFPPGFHVWTSHRLGWQCLGEGLPTYGTTRAAEGADTPPPPRREA